MVRGVPYYRRIARAGRFPIPFGISGNNTLRIAYLTDMPPEDRNIYSGGNRRIFETLERHVGEVSVVPQDWGPAEPVRQAILSTSTGMNMRLRWRAHYALRGVVGRRVTRYLEETSPDVVFGAYALHALSGVRVPGQVVSAFTSDAVQTVFRCSEIGAAHDRTMPLAQVMDGWVERREADVLRQLDLGLWPSEWLRTAVDERYGLAPGVGKCVEWGAGIEAPEWSGPKVLDPKGTVRLLVLGRDWFTKGGPLTFDTLNVLRAQGVDAHLTVVGCVPPDMHINEHVTVRAHLDKAVPAELALFEAALREAHFMVMPSHESYGFAFCEASAWGMPSLCLRVGGVPVRDGENGYALPPGSGAEDFARLIREHLAAPERYTALSRTSRTIYETRLNWDAWGKRVKILLEEAVAMKRRDPQRRSA